jgi:uncharacterized phiE125 gp8 family phage protein
MPLALTLAVAPTEEPITTAEAKAQARVDISTDDTLIASLITAARQLVEEQTWRALVTQRWDLYLDAWPAGDTILLPRPPLRSIVTFEYTSDTAVVTAVPASDYLVDAVSEPGRLRLKSTASWPSATLREINGVHIRFEAGYGAAAAVPARFKQAILLLVATWYENRETLAFASMPKELPYAVTALLNLDHARTF